MSPAARPIERKIAQQAARWFLCLQAVDATDQQRAACAEWRQAHADHERAWLLAVRFSDQVQSIPADIGRSTLQRPAGMGRRTALKALTSLVVLGSVGFTLSRTDSWRSAMADVRTAVGEQRHMTLSDGTEIHLDTDSAVDIRYSAESRVLVLRKGALFVSTARDQRPLHVESAHGLFQPLGTRFAIRHNDDRDLLTVIEGSVVAAPRQALNKGVTVAAGQRASVTSQQATLLEGAASRVDWVDGVLRAERLPLGELVAEIGRYRHGWTRCAPEIVGLPVSGAFQLHDTDSALAAIALTFPVRVHYITRYWVSLLPA